MKKILYQILALFTILALPTGCDVFEPEDDNIYDDNDVNSVVTFVEGFLMNAYRNLPTSHQSFNLSYACDDAVTNDPTSSVKTAITGGWTSSSNPFSTWNTTYESILYINTFLEKMDGLNWYYSNEETTEKFDKKLRGEAHALRAWNYFQLLQAHAGKGTNGQMLGVPLVKTVLSPNDPSEYQVPRSSFSDLVEFILEDCELALGLLPDRWIDTGDADADVAIGVRNNNRINGLAVRLIKAKTLLYAASPAYSDGTYTYQMAAVAAAELMDGNNGLTDVAGGSVEFYNNTDVSGNENEHPEVLWYSRRQDSGNSWETANYSPSQYGKGGLTNPTQDLVNAFPLLDGTPAPVSKINSGDPYSDRDPRLGKFIFYNGAQYTKSGQTRTVNTTSGSQDAFGSTDIYATKTGYYLRKFMNVRNVDLDPSVNSKGLHYYTYARYTDALLIFAEAANEAAGPDADIGGYNARQVLNEIRNRAGITSTAYVDGLGQAEMTDLIRNERRIEMCFEKQRFWDLRRWKLTTKMNSPVYGVQVSADGSSYNYLQVEDRNYSDYQIYGPIPYSETLKYSIVQNEGW
jgi:hypothetical protein